MALKGQIQVIEFRWLFFLKKHAATNVYYKYIFEVHVYDLSVNLNTYETLWPLEVKSRSNNLKCNISASNCPIALKCDTGMKYWMPDVQICLWLDKHPKSARDDTSFDISMSYCRIAHLFNQIRLYGLDKWFWAMF